MPTFVAKPSPWRQALLALGAAVFVVAGAWLVGAFGPDHPPAPVWIGWAAMAFFGFCGLLALRRIFDQQDLLRIGPSGVWYRLWSDQTIPWSEIDGVGEWSMQGQKTIVLKLAHPERFPSSTMLGRVAFANRALTGGDVVVTLTGSDKSFDEAMTECRRYLRK